MRETLRPDFPSIAHPTKYEYVDVARLSRCRFTFPDSMLLAMEARRFGAMVKDGERFHLAEEMVIFAKAQVVRDRYIMSNYEN